MAKGVLLKDKDGINEVLPLTDVTLVQGLDNVLAAKYEKPSTGIPASDIASGVIPDVSNFVTASVNNLVNYYLKSETYTKAEVESLISTINSFKYEIYASTSAVTTPSANVLYLIGPTGSGADKYEEYVYSNNTWVKIGDTSIDLSGYYQFPSGGIPEADLDSAVRTSLGKADTALQSFTETDPTVPSWAKASNKPSYSYSEISNTPSLATVATSGSYTDLSNRPTIPDAQIQSDWNQTNTEAKDYIKNKPSIPSGVVVDQVYDGTSANAQSGVAMAGALADKQDVIDSSHKLSYNLLTDTPTIPAAQVQTDWNATSGMGEILHKPTLATVATSGSYNDLSNKPTIPDVTGKADKVSSATSGNFAALDANGNLTDSGHKHSDYLTAHQDISGKADKVSSATNGNFAGLDSNGNLIDSGKKASDFGTYSKPSGGIPASDLASGVIPTVPTDVVKYTEQTLTALQKWVARNNIGAGTYSKPSGGIPKTDLAQAVSTTLNRADAAILYTDLGEPDWEEYDYDTSAFLTTLRTTGYYSFTMDEEYVYHVTVQAVEMGDYTYVLQQYFGSEEGPGSVYYRGFVYDNEGDEVVSDNDMSYMTIQQASDLYANKTHYHYTSVRDSVTVWSYCDTMSTLDATSEVVYTDQTTSTQWLIEGAYSVYQPAIRYQKVTPLQGGTCFYQRCGTVASNTVTWGAWYRFDAVMPIATTQPQGGFLPNLVYDLGTLTGTVTFALASPTDNTTPNAYHWTFETGSTAPTINWPSSITWPTDFTPEVNTNCHYEVLIRNSYATLLEFSLE